MNPTMDIYRPFGQRTTTSQLSRFLMDMAKLSIPISFDGLYDIEDGEHVGTRCPRGINVAREMIPVYTMGSTKPAAIHTGAIAVSITMDGLSELDNLDCIITSQSNGVRAEMRGVIRAVDHDAAVLDMIGTI